MIRENNFLKNKELTQAKLDVEKKSIDQNYKGTNQEQLGKTKFQDIADQRYQNKMYELSGNKFDVNKMIENAKKKKKGFDTQRDILFYKKWN